MRVGFDLTRDGLPAIEDAATRLAAAQQQLATGRRVSAASDDPAAVQQAIGERGTIAAIDSYTATADSASTRLAAADAVLGSMIGKLTAAIVAGASARGSSVTPASRSAAAAEVRSLRDALVADINTTFNGASLFSGTAVTTTAYAQTGGAWVYQGDADTVQVEIERGRTVRTTLDGRALAQGADAADVFTMLDDLAAAIEAGDETAIAAGMAALDRAFDRVSRAQGQLGADERAVDDAAARLSALRVAAEVRRSKLEDANLAEAVTRMTEADTAYRAALGAAASSARVSLLDFLR